MKQAQEVYEKVLVKKSRERVVLGDSRQSFDNLVELCKQQPNLNVRSGDSLSRQAYSTPNAFAFIASELAGINQDTKVLENSAGNGMLLIGTAKENAIVNELDQDRVDALNEIGFGSVTQGSALECETGQPVDAYIANPPFGRMDKPMTFDGVDLKAIDHAIVAKGLESMADNGKASFNIGANKKEAEPSPADRAFFQWLYSNYRVVDHFEVDGKLYTGGKVRLSLLELSRFTAGRSQTV